MNGHFFTPAARVLSTPELALHIAHDSNLRKRDLASLALVCKDLTCPATEVLWASMNSLLPLFKTFPQDMWRMELDDDDRSQLVLTRQPRDLKEFSRVEVYANKIKKLFAQDLGVAPESLACVVRYLGDHCRTLLPALRTLRVGDQEDGDLLPLVLRLPGCLLVSLGIFTRITRPVELLALFNRSTELEKVVIDVNFSQDFVEDAVILDYTEQAHTPNGLVRALWHLPKLSALTLDKHLLNIGDHQLGALPSEPSIFTDGGGFGSLISISLSMPQLDALSLSFVRQLRSRKITRVELIKMKGSDQEDIEEHLDVISQLPCADVLERLEVQMNQNYDGISYDGFYGSRTNCEIALRPLMRLHTLRYLRFENDNLWASPSFLSELAQALPNIERLVIRQTEILPDHTYPKLADALPPFSRHCPKLVFLGLDVDVCGPIPNPPFLTDPGRSNLYTLCIGFGKALYDLDEDENDLDIRPDIAHYLRAIFPNLVEFGGTEDSDTQYPEIWYEVNALLSALNPPMLPDYVMVPKIGEYY